MTKLELLRKLHDEINAIGGVPITDYETGLNDAVGKALDVIEREILAEELVQLELKLAMDEFFGESSASQMEN